MWFTETPWPPILILSMLAALLLIAFQAQRRVAYLIGIAVIVLSSGGIYVVEQQIVTESERVEAGVFGVTTAFRKQDLPATLEFFAPDNLKDRQLVTSAIGWVSIEDKIRITDLDVKMSSDEKKAVSHFRANVSGEDRTNGRMRRYASRWEFTWQSEAGEWRIIKIQRLHVMSGEPVDLLSAR